MVNIAVCDDEPYMLDELSARLGRYAAEHRLTFQISRFADSRALIESGAAFDVIFLDIQMEPMDGMETAHRLRKNCYSGLLIFTTVLQDAVFDSFEVEAFDYLVKPLEDSRLERTLARMARALEEGKQKHLVVQKWNTFQMVPFSRLLYCEVMGRKIYLHQQNGEVIDYYEKMGRLAGQLDERFFQCHRSYMVNLDFVHGCKEGFVLLSDGSRIPVSRLREQALTQALLAHMKERNR